MHDTTADTMELRRQFADQFLVSPQDHPTAILDGPMEALIEEFDTQITVAKSRYPSINVDAEFAEMDRWLDERGYTDPETR